MNNLLVCYLFLYNISIIKNSILTIKLNKCNKSQLNTTYS